MLGQREVSNLLSRWKSIGHEIKDDGTELIGRAPHVASEAWMHYIFAPNNSIEFREKYQYLISGFDHYYFSRIFNEINGICLFSQNLFIFGNRTSYRRDGSVFQPWELDNGIWEGRELGVGDDVVVFGGSHTLPDGIFFAETKAGEILAIDRASPETPMFRWPDFDCFFEGEINRLSRLFDDNGRVLNRRALSDFEL